MCCLFLKKNPRKRWKHFRGKSMPLAGLEPARFDPLDFESSASANSATAACKPEIIVT